MTDTIAPTFTVGRFYDVPCVRPGPNISSDWDRVMPVIGPAHDDKEIIGFPERHWHIDWRFVSTRLWTRWTDGGKRDLIRAIFGRVISQKNVEGDAYSARRKCQRQMPTFPLTYPRQYFSEAIEEPVPWMAALEDAYASKTLKLGCLTCPHRGISLAGLPAVDGVVVCPGHGLAWNVKTGELVRRTGVRS